VITSALTLGKVITLLAAALIAACHLLLGGGMTPDAVCRRVHPQLARWCASPTSPPCLGRHPLRPGARQVLAETDI